MTPHHAAPDAPRLRRPVRLALLLWVLVVAVVWNGLYDVRISLGVRDYLLQAALHEAGRVSEPAMAELMRHTVRESVKLATFWATLVLAAGLATIWLLALPATPPPPRRT